MTELRLIHGTVQEVSEPAERYDPTRWPQVYSEVPVGPGVWVRAKGGRRFHVARELTIYRHVETKSKRRLLDIPPHQRPGMPSHIHVKFACGGGSFDSGLTYHDLEWVLIHGPKAFCPRCVAKL